MKRIFRRFIINNINIGLILSTPVLNWAFFLGSPADTLIII